VKVVFIMLSPHDSVGEDIVFVRRIRSSRQILLPRYLVNCLSNL